MASAPAVQMGGWRVEGQTSRCLRGSSSSSSSSSSRGTRLQGQTARCPGDSRLFIDRSMPVKHTGTTLSGAHSDSDSGDYKLRALGGQNTIYSVVAASSLPFWDDYISTTVETTHYSVDTSSANQIWCVVGYPESALVFSPMVLQSTVRRALFPAAMLASDAAMAAAWTIYMVSACSAQVWCSLPGGTQPTLLLGIGPGAHTQHIRAVY